MKKYRYILFDLDSTIINASSVSKAIDYALGHAGVGNDIPRKPMDTGTSLKHYFSTFYDLNETQTELAASKYREWYINTGVYHASLNAGVEPLLRALKQRGHELFSISSRPSFLSRILLERYNLAELFVAITGTRFGETFRNKADVIRDVLLKRGISGLTADLSEAVMIGSRSNDIAGAKRNDIDSIGVPWDYGNIKDLEEAGADYIAAGAEELAGLLMSGYSAE